MTTSISLFSGAMGLDLGLMQSGIDNMFCCKINVDFVVDTLDNFDDMC